MRKVVLFLLLITFVSFASAGTITSVVVYGDSLSDNGNLFAATGQPGAPYWQGRRSNGPVAVEDMAATLNVPLHDFAWIGATTGIGNYADHGTPTAMGGLNLPGMQAQLATTTALVPGFSGAMFVVWGGPNDFLSPSPDDNGDPLKIADRAAADIVGIVAALQNLGAQNILVPDMPDLGLTPYFNSIGKAAFGSYITDYFNTKLLSELPSGAIFFDTAGLMRSIVANPGAYGFTNVTEPCFDAATSTVCANPDQYLFYDSFHPSAAAHAILGREFASVPEPATCVLIFSGALVALRKKGLLRR